MSKPFELSFDMVWVGYGCSAVSLIASLYVIISYLKYEDRRQNYFCFLIANICLMDIFFAISSVTAKTPESDGLDSPICIGFGFLRTFANLNSYFFNSLFAWALFCSLTITNEMAKSSSHYYRRVIIIYICCLIASSLPLSTQSIGMGTLYCDLKVSHNTTEIIWQIVVYIVPFMISFSIIFTLMVTTIWKVKKLYSQASIGMKIFRLLLFPAIFLLVNSGAFVSRIANQFEDNLPDWLEIYHFLGRQLQGVIHGGIYGFIFLYDRQKFEKDQLVSKRQSMVTIPELVDSSNWQVISEVHLQ